jgi:WD repeat-containing protein 19
VQVLTIGTDGGAISTYLASLPTVYDSFQTKVVYLTSLSEVSVVDIATRTLPLKIQLATEPAFCGMGPDHVAAGINNQVGDCQV